MPGGRAAYTADVTSAGVPAVGVRSLSPRGVDVTLVGRGRPAAG